MEEENKTTSVTILLTEEILRRADAIVEKINIGELFNRDDVLRMSITRGLDALEILTTVDVDLPDKGHVVSVDAAGNETCLRCGEKVTKKRVPCKGWSGRQRT